MRSATFYAARSIFLFCAIVLVGLAFVAPAHASAQEILGVDVPGPFPLAVAVPVIAEEVAYGDLIDYDPDRAIYVLSQLIDDPYVYGVAVKDPPLTYGQSDADVPLARSGQVLVNVTLENGPILRGDEIIASSYPGKAMRAASSSENILGKALEDFSGEEATTTAITLPSGRQFFASTILVELEKLPGRGPGEKPEEIKPPEVPVDSCSPIWKCIPLGVLARYLTAALVAFGSVYLAFKSFMADAVSGVASIGRNPSAKNTIQSMVVFNALLAVALAVAGLIAGLVILFIKI